MSRSMEGKSLVGTAITSAEDNEGYTILIKPDGSFQLQAETGPDHVDAMDAVSKIGPMLSEPYVRNIMADG